MGPEEGSVYADFLLSCGGKEIVSDRPSTQVKHKHNSKKKKYNSEVMEK